MKLHPICLAVLSFSFLAIPYTANSAPASKESKIIYVDNVTGNDSNPGTAAQPKATIQAGENAAESLYGNDCLVVVRGGGPAYEETVTISSSMRFPGNGAGIPGAGASFHGVARPIVK